MNNITIIEKPDWVTWNEIHNIIWKAHEANRQHGINMRLPSLLGEEIEKHGEGKGKMFVALDSNKVVGTAAVIRTQKTNFWCGDGEYAYLCFVSVLPNYRGQGVYKHLHEYIEKVSIKNGLYRLMFDTHEDNARIAEINLKHGYKKVSYKRSNDHFSIIFVKWLERCPYSTFRFKYEFIKCKFVVKTKHVLKLLLNK